MLNMNTFHQKWKKFVLRVVWQVSSILDLDPWLRNYISNLKTFVCHLDIISNQCAKYEHLQAKLKKAVGRAAISLTAERQSGWVCSCRSDRVTERLVLPNVDHSVQGSITAWPTHHLIALSLLAIHPLS